MKKEPWLGNPGSTIEILHKYGFHFQKKYGQNFLVDGNILDEIVRAAGIGPEDSVIEIGPGIGTLTQYLAYAAKKVYAVEIDRHLLPILEDTLSDWDNVTVIHSDILKMDLERFIEKENEGEPIKVAANLPYYITTPILMELLEKDLPFTSITVMVQKEVADRMKAGPGSRDYGALSLAVQYYTEPEIRMIVPPGSFIPRPKVDSAVIRLTMKSENERVRVKDERMLFRVIRASFAQRRKTLVNGLRGSKELALTREIAEKAVAGAGLPADIRGEKLSLEEFARLSDEILDLTAESL